MMSSNSATGVTTVFVGNYFEWNVQAGTMTKYYYAGAERIAMRSGTGTGTAGLAWILGDHLGSTAITVDAATGAKLSELRFKPWGEVRYEWGATGTKYRFQGQRSTEFDLYDFNARFYDARLGRYVQPDSIVPLASQGVQAWDRYAGLNNNPVRFNDPTGHDVGCSAADPECENQNTYTPPVTFSNDPYNDPEYSIWRRLLEGSKCAACHVTHDGYLDNGGIPNNTELDPALVGYYRSLDQIAIIVHAFGLFEAGQLGNAALSAQSTIDRAVNLHKAIPEPIRQRMTTTAVLTTDEGVTFVSSSNPSLDPAQRALLLPGEIEVLGQAGVHAEQKLVIAAESSGLTPNTMLVSRDVCPMCQALLGFFNIPSIVP